MHCLARLARPTAHEVRGALSALNIHLELLAGALDTDDAIVRDRRTRHLVVLRGECARLQRITDAFIALAALPDRPDDSDLGTLVSGVLEAVRPLAITRRVQLEATPISPGICPGAELEASRQRLLDALVETLGAATAGSVVRIEPAPGGQSVRVQGADGACIEISLSTSRSGSDA
jgi:signal transduction histidine kinase